MKGLSNFQVTFLMGAIVAALAIGIWAYQPTEVPPELAVRQTLSAMEIRDRFAGNIVEGVHETKNFTFTHFYSPTGALISTRSDRGRNRGTWHIDVNDRLCIHLNGDEELCRGVIEIGGVTKKFVKTRRGQTKFVVTFKSFRAGGPDDL